MSQDQSSSTANSAAANRAAYEKRLNRVRDYIYEHLAEDIDLNTLAEVAHMSPYHWHRIYRSISGETIAATVKRLRMTRAVDLISRTSLPIEEIAVKTGYPNTQSFSRVFKATFGMPPGKYREDGSHSQFDTTNKEDPSTMHPVNVQELETTRVVSLHHNGVYTGISKAFETLYGTVAARGMLTPDMQMIGVFYDDPDSVPEADLRSRACLAVNSDLDLDSPYEHFDISGGKYAVLEYTGPYGDMHAAYRWFYGTWLAESGFEAANEPAYEVYINSPTNTPPAELRTNIHMPLA